MTLHVLILAAGFGTRLRPLTESTPKPLLPLVDRTLFEFQLAALSELCKAEPVEIHANAHHLADQVEAHAVSLGVRVWREDGEILGTGGPLHRMAAAGLRGELLILNGDNWHEFDLLRFVRNSRSSAAGLGLLAGRDPQVDTLLVAKQSSELRGLKDRFDMGGWDGRATFTGISWYGAQAWGDIRSEERDIRTYWHRRLQQGLGIYVDSSQQDRLWFDVGTPEGLYRANFAELTKRGLEEWIHPDAQVTVGCAKQSIIGAGAILPQGCRVQNTVVLPGTHLQPGENLSWAIAAGPWRWHAEPPVALPQTEGVHPELCLAVCEALESLHVSIGHLHWESAGSAGSGRSYWRLRAQDGRSWVLQQSHTEDPDWHRFVSYGRTLLSLGLSVPCLYAVDEPARQVLQEDLGSERLWDHWQQHADLDVYRRVLHGLTAWQMQSTHAFAECPEMLDRIFDFRGLRWETEYFTEHYLTGHLGHTVIPSALHAQFDALAQRVAAHPRGLMHRDFQSHNIMVHQGRMVFIDFQGARPGSLYYDAASLLWDPYVMLPALVVRELFLEWTASHPLLWEVGDEENWNRFCDASAQRIMQALGAYCNLSRNKGIQSFAQYIGPGEARLRGVLECQALSGNCREMDEPIGRLYAAILPLVSFG